MILCSLSIYHEQFAAMTRQIPTLVKMIKKKLNYHNGRLKACGKHKTDLPWKSMMDHHEN